MTDAAPHSAPPIRVMIVEDSAVVRGLVSRVLRETPGIELVASAFNGAMALEQLARTPADVILLDIEMPEMDGITALPQLLKLAPAARVIMVSTLSQRGASMSLKALQLGASETIAKPAARADASETRLFYDELIGTIRALAPRRAVASLPAAAVRYPQAQPRAIAIAASTGGPQALTTIFRELAVGFPPVPVFVTQHMPPTFTAMLAQHLGKLAGRPCREGADGERVEAGTIYFAPGDFHLRAQKDGDGARLCITQDPPVNFCRPAADPMLQSLAKLYGRHLLAAILTGMGTDGLAGAREVKAAGGTVIAQDEASSVVWGMPRGVTEEKIACAVLPIDAIAAYLRKACA